MMDHAQQDLIDQAINKEIDTIVAALAVASIKAVASVRLTSDRRGGSSFDFGVGFDLRQKWLSIRRIYVYKR